jgi:DNA invertase Pin-like site-specific DNA recombinase
MQIGYARSSTIDQGAGYEAQIQTLNAAGYDKVFSEKVSSVGQRDQLEPALDYAREGDALVVTKLDRLARSVFHLVAIGERLESKGVAPRLERAGAGLYPCRQERGTPGLATRGKALLHG